MSTTVTVAATAYSIQAAKSTTQYGTPSSLPVRSGQANVMVRCSLSKIPTNATVVSAYMRFTVNEPHSGSGWNLRVHPITGAWPSQVTWAKRPAAGAAAGTKSVSSPKRGTNIDVPITAAVQQLVSRQRTDRGWMVATDKTSVWKLIGSSASGGRPAIIVKYTTPPPVPTGLEPSNASVTTDKPTLLFAADPNILGLQIQVDPAANSAAPAFDSGDVTASGGLLDLAETTYPGLANGATTWWRARQRTDGGWGGWSSWATFTRQTRSALAITSPAAAPDADGNTPVGDGTPPVAWTFAGTQLAYRVRLVADNGDTIADSGYTPGSDKDWTPPTGLVTDGQTALLQVEVWDDAERAATPGDPVEAIATLPIVLEPDVALSPFTEVTASADWFEPLVTVSGHRAAIPDYVALTRDGTEVGRWPGVDLAVVDPGGGYSFTVTDPSAVMGRSQTWRLVPVVNGVKGSGGAGVARIPTCEGVWLTSVDDPTQRVVILDVEAGQDQPEASIVHQPLGDAQVVPVVRRRLLRTAPQGAIAGRLADTARTSASAHESRLRGFVAADAGERYWLTLGGYTAQVIIGDAVFTELDARAKTTSSNPATPSRVLGVAFSWWAQ